MFEYLYVEIAINAMCSNKEFESELSSNSSRQFKKSYESRTRFD